jgi:hypothetical protein
MAYFTRLDVANRALQHLGVPRIASFTDSSKAARETNFAVDKLRRAELQRSVWTFATRRAVMRELISTSSILAFVTYASGTTYGAGDIVKDSNGFLWISQKGSNTGHTPGSEGVYPFWVPYHGPVVAPLHSTSAAYLPGDLVVSTNLYICVAANTNQVPPNTTYWHEVDDASATSIVPLTPIGYERDATTLRKIYRLPANWLRMAPQDPKMASGVRQNMTAGMAYNDWEVEEPYLFTADTSPFVLRFVADVTDVSTMHPLFCEVWAARMAIELADTLTQNGDKQGVAAGLYERYMDAAQMLNAVEAGTTEGEPRAAAAAQQGRQQQGQG